MDMVTVGCRLPHGIVMELIEPGELRLPAPRGDFVEIKGANSLRIKGTNPLMGQFAYTQVDKSLAVEWFKRNANHPAVKGGALVMHETASGAAAKGKERANERTGFEPLNPDAPPKGVEPDKERLQLLKSTVL